MKKLVSFTAFGMILIFALGACSRYATPTADTYLCVYDGSERGGQKLKFQLPPSAESRNIGDQDQVVSIPASNRFYMASEDDQIRDPLAPHFYQAFAKGSIQVKIEGQIRFRFNLSKACDWYAKHGRRNEPLNFNARGGAGNNSGWLRFLAENFGVTMQQVATAEVNKFDWAALTFDFPVNADPNTGLVAKSRVAGESAKAALGKDLGDLFSKQLTANLGGDYFCGIEAVAGDDCPAMSFQVISVKPFDENLLAERAKLQALQEELRNAQAEARLGVAKQRLLATQLKIAQMQAAIDNAKCLQLARYGLDCNGNRPPQYAGTYNPSGPQPTPSSS